MCGEIKKGKTKTTGLEAYLQTSSSTGHVENNVYSLTSCKWLLGVAGSRSEIDC